MEREGLAASVEEAGPQKTKIFYVLSVVLQKHRQGLFLAPFHVGRLLAHGVPSVEVGRGAANPELAFHRFEASV